MAWKGPLTSKGAWGSCSLAWRGLQVGRVVGPLLPLEGSNQGVTGRPGPQGPSLFGESVPWAAQGDPAVSTAAPLLWPYRTPVVSTEPIPLDEVGTLHQSVPRSPSHARAPPWASQDPHHMAPGRGGPLTRVQGRQELWRNCPRVHTQVPPGHRAARQAGADVASATDTRGHAHATPGHPPHRAPVPLRVPGVRTAALPQRRLAVQKGAGRCGNLLPLPGGTKPHMSLKPDSKDLRKLWRDRSRLPEG